MRSMALRLRQTCCGCGESDVSQFGSINGNVYLVWYPDRGGSREDGRRVRSHSPEGAAIAWAQWDDARSADYTIVGGQPAEIVVAEDRHGSPEYLFTVTGESCPVYTAREGHQ